jgi:type VI secretion system protein ImpJ
MNWDGKVVWTEGMFLRPQHFQQQDRYTEWLVRARIGGLSPFAWGVSELAINRDLLAVGKFAVLRARGIFEDGTPFDIPQTDPPPPPIDLPEGLTNAEIYLTVPARRPQGVEVEIAETFETAARYGAQKTETVDGVAGSTAVADIRIARLRLGFRLQRQELGGYHRLGLARVLEVKADKRAVPDDRFIPPALNAMAHPPLAGFVNETLGLLRHRADAIAARVAGGGGRGVAEVADFLMLQAINRVEPVLAGLTQLPDLHAQTLHAHLLALAGEFATFTAASKRPPGFPPYRHDDLQGTFEPVMAEIRRSLSAVLEQNAVAIPLQERKYGIRVGAVADRALLTAASFVLAVKADMAGEALRRNFPALVKIGPVEQIRELVNSQLPGVRVRALPAAPRQIPFHAGAAYFELERGSPIWSQLSQSGGVAVHLAGDFPGVTMELWAIRG